MEEKARIITSWAAQQQVSNSSRFEERPRWKRRCRLGNIAFAKAFISVSRFGKTETVFP